jgi:hypothetical protein
MQQPISDYHQRDPFSVRGAQIESDDDADKKQADEQTRQQHWQGVALLAQGPSAHYQFRRAEGVFVAHQLSGGSQAQPELIEFGPPHDYKSGEIFCHAPEKQNKQHRKLQQEHEWKCPAGPVLPQFPAEILHQKAQFQSKSVQPKGLETNV